jgi:hypothetical protein
MAAGGMAFELGIAVTAVIAVMEMYSGSGVLVSCLSCGFAAGALCQKMGCGSRAAFLALCGLGGVIGAERDDADFICLLSQLYLVRCAVKDRIEPRASQRSSPAAGTLSCPRPSRRAARTP